MYILKNIEYNFSSNYCFFFVCLFFIHCQNQYFYVKWCIWPDFWIMQSVVVCYCKGLYIPLSSETLISLISWCSGHLNWGWCRDFPSRDYFHRVCLTELCFPSPSAWTSRRHYRTVNLTSAEILERFSRLGPWYLCWQTYAPTWHIPF